MGKKINPGNQPDGFPTLNFGNNNKLFGSTGCNRFIGSFKTDKNLISLEPGAVTKMHCQNSPEEAWHCGSGEGRIFEAEPAWG